MTLHAPDVSISAFLLGLLCLWLAYRSWPGGAAPRWLAVVLGGAAVGSFGGAVARGLFALDPAALTVPEGSPPLLVAIWAGMMLGLGIAGVGGTNLGLELVPPRPAVHRAVRRATLVALAVFTLYVVTGRRPYLVAIAFYLPAALFLLVTIGRALANRPAADLGLAAAGIGLTFAAAGLQQAQIGLHPEYFNHNALYHLLSAAGLVLLQRLATWSRRELGVENAAQGAGQSVNVELGTGPG